MRCSVCSLHGGSCASVRYNHKYQLARQQRGVMAHLCHQADWRRHRRHFWLGDCGLQQRRNLRRQGWHQRSRSRRLSVPLSASTCCAVSVEFWLLGGLCVMDQERHDPAALLRQQSSEVTKGPSSASRSCQMKQRSIAPCLQTAPGRLPLERVRWSCCTPAHMKGRLKLY